MKRNKGISVTEYGLIAGTISLILLPSLFLLGQKLSQYASEMVPDRKTTAIASISSVSPSVVSSGGGVQNSANTSYVKFTPQKLGETVATMGANGTTELLADEIVESAKQQLAAGSITQAQYNKLIALAKEGFNLAGLQAAVETAATKLKGGKDIKSIDVIVNGQAMSIQDIWEKIGYTSEPSSLPTDISQRTGAPREALQDFLDAYASAERSGALQDPAVKAYISSLSTQIVQINGAMDMLLWDSSSITTSDTLTSGMISKLTSNNSSQICQAGNGTVSNGDCAQ